MAVHFTDGFDHYTTQTGMTDTRGWTFSGSNVTIHTTAGKYGGGALDLTDATSQVGYVSTKPVGTISAGNTLCVGFSFKSSTATLPAAQTEIMTLTDESKTSIDSNSDGHARMRITTSGHVNCLGGGGSGAPVITVATNVCDGNWHWIEMAYKPANSGGIFRLAVDGSAAAGDITSGDTLGVSGGVDKINRLLFECNANQNASYYIDDVIVYDDISSGISGDLTYTSNYPLGEIRIETLLPNAVGTNSDWTPTSGSNYTNVDDAQSDGDTTVVTSATATDLDTYGFTNLSGTPSSVLGVHTTTVARTTPGGSTDIKHVALSGATTGESATISLSQGYERDQVWFGVDPNTTSAWTDTNINAAEFGLEKQ